MSNQVKVYETYVGPNDPCPPIRRKTYSTPPHLYTSYQPMCLPQFNAYEALKLGTLWPAFYSPYEAK